MMDSKYDEAIQIGEKVLTMDPHNGEAAQSDCQRTEGKRGLRIDDR